MRLLTLTVRNYRVHKELTVQFDSARTLIGGPNESGKSTLAEAAHRALFLRSKTGGNVHKEMVSTLHNGDPEVILTFEASGACWELEKRFAGSKGSTRLTRKGGEGYREEEAETKLSELLKSETAGGRSAAGLLPDLWSHLWVWQGRAGEDPSAHTSHQKERLVQHLQQSDVTNLLQSSTDQRVANRIADSYSEVFTNTGRLKAGSRPELARLRFEEASKSLECALEVATRLAQAADDHTRAERDIAEIQGLLPKLRTDRSSTEAKLREVGTLRREEDINRQAVKIAASNRKEFESQDRILRELRTQLTARTAELKPAEAKLNSLAEVERGAYTANQAAETNLKETSQFLRTTRLHYDLLTAAVAAFEKAEIHQSLSARAAEATALERELATLRSDLAKLPTVDAKELTRLRSLESTVAQSNAALEAMATGIELIESTDPVVLDGKPLHSKELRILTDDGELQVGAGTHLRIRPGGGSSLADARQRCEKARNSLSDALHALSLRDLEHAATALEQRQALGSKITSVEARWQALGGDALTIDLARVTIECDAATEELQRRISLSSANASTTLPESLVAVRALLTKVRDVLGNAESADATAHQQSDLLRERLEAASKNLFHHRDTLAVASQTLRDLGTAIKTREETHGDEAALAQGLGAARDAETQATERLTATQEALVALNPDLLTTDLDRFGRALTIQEARLRGGENTLLLTRDRLALDGSIDPEAELHFAEVSHVSAQESYNTELRRAKAIESLHQLFTASREAIDQALVQPLAGRITGYLQCLFGLGTEARVRLSDLGIASLELSRPSDPAFSFATLSGGTKEQVAAAVRLALAEILAADHDGTLPIIFDDAFAYSDPDRIQTLQRMLALAAVRGLQVIVLTCSPNDYSSFGASEQHLRT